MEKLKQLLRENKVIPFVGAGVSKDVKYKNDDNAFLNWNGLLNSLAKNISDENKKNGINFLLKSNKVDYLKIADMIEDELTLEEFNESLQKAFDVDYNEIDDSGYKLAKSIWDLDSKLVITTNYDDVLYHACENKNKKNWDIESEFEQASYLKNGVDNPVIWNLHGHIGKVENVILTSKKYNEFYTRNVEDSKYKASLETLRNISSSKTFLFIGFSLNDEFVVEQLNRTIEIFGGNSSNHYILCKKGSKPKTLNDNIKTVEYENHGQDLINKINSLKSHKIIIDEKRKTIKADEKSTKKQNTFNALTKLPAINKEFVGRKKELKEIEKKLKNDSLTYIVNGIGGIGKSELSSQYFHENKNRYKNVAFVEVTQETKSLEEVFIREFKEKLLLDENSTLDTIIQRLQGLPKKNLLLLDNLENREDFEKIKALNVNFDLLITTRIKDIDTKYQLDLETLNPEDAKELFLSIYDKDKNIDDILEYLDNHPLFINLMAKSLDKEYLTLDELRRNITSNTITKIDSTDDKTFQEHLQNTFDKQFKNENNPKLKELLQILAIYPSIEIPLEILEKTITIDKLKVKLQKLVEHGWLSKKDNSYKLHQIIKTFILSEYKVEYNNITFILDNIANYINPDDSTLVANKLNEYIPIIDSLLELFKKEDNHICGVLDSLTFLHYSLVQYKESMKYQNVSLKIRQKIYGEDSEFTARSYNLLSIVYQSMGELAKALKYQEKALVLREEILGDKHPDLAISFSNISTIYQAMGELDKALEYQEKDLKVTEEILGEKHPSLATSFSNISIIYQNMGELDKALEYQEKSLKLREEILGDKHPSLATSFNNISIIYKDMGELDKALEYQEKSLKLKEEILGDKHPSLATSFNNISMIYHDMGELDKALEYQEKALNLTEETLGDKHPDLAISFNNISLVYIEKKECLKVKEFISKAINIWQETGYFKKELFEANKILKDVEFNIKKQKKFKNKKKGKYCNDI